MSTGLSSQGSAYPVHTAYLPLGMGGCMRHQNIRQETGDRRQAALHKARRAQRLQWEGRRLAGENMKGRMSLSLPTGGILEARHAQKEGGTCSAWPSHHAHAPRLPGGRLQSREGLASVRTVAHAQPYTPTAQAPSSNCHPLIPDLIISAISHTLAQPASRYSLSRRPQ